MARTIRTTGKKQPRIRNVGNREPMIDSQTVADALGGTPQQQVPRTGSPITLSLVREELARTLKSTGGRPTIEGTDRRFKIPLSDAQLRALEWKKSPPKSHPPAKSPACSSVWD